MTTRSDERIEFHTRITGGGHRLLKIIASLSGQTIADWIDRTARAEYAALLGLVRAKEAGASEEAPKVYGCVIRELMDLHQQGYITKEVLDERFAYYASQAHDIGQALLKEKH